MAFETHLAAREIISEDICVRTIKPLNMSGCWLLDETGNRILDEEANFILGEAAH